jgi:hypothetical protein
MLRRSGIAVLAAIAISLAGATAIRSAASSVAATDTLAQPRSATAFMLLTGERVVETKDASGRPQFAVTSGAVPVFIDQVGPTRYLVDATALPFMGRELDPSLFTDTSAAAAAGDGVAVVVDWRGKAAPAMSWLESQQTVAPGVTDGRITTASAPALRAALAQEARSSPDAWSGSLSGIDRISAQGATAAPHRQSPLFVQYTLTVKGVDATGLPDNGDLLFLLNTDNSSKYQTTFARWADGVIKLSVPNGHYSLLGQFVMRAASSPESPDGGGSGGVASLAMVVMDVTVVGDTTVTLDARTATSSVSVATPRPTESGGGSVDWQRIAAAAPEVLSVEFSWGIGLGFPPTHVSVTPTPAPKFGTQGWAVSYHLDAPPGIVSSYSYDLTFGATGAIRPNQHYRVESSQLASIATRYYSDVTNRVSGEFRIGQYNWQSFGVGWGTPFNAPAERTEYVLAVPNLVWSQEVADDWQDLAGMFMDSFHIFRRGEHTTADWGRGPSGPGVAVDTGVALENQFCPVCFEQNSLEFNVLPFADNPPGHVGSSNIGVPGVTETDTATLDRNGVTIFAGADPEVSVPVPAGPAHYALDYSVTMSAPWWTLSTSTTTAWTFSTPLSFAQLPKAGWLCFSLTTIGCKVVGLMFADYALPLNMLNQMPPGAVRFDIGIDHVLGAAIAVNQPTVSVSFDGGVTWRAAQVSRQGADGFSVSYVNPPGRGTASLRIHVTDADGGSLSQTIDNAYGIS